jgi:MraZ protein
VAKVNTTLEDEVQGQRVFVSTFTHSLDPKRRLTIPSEWRAQVGEPRSLYVLPHLHDDCLCVFPAEEMVRRLEKMRHHSLGDRQARQFARALASQSDLVSWDSQGRIRIKDALLSYAGLVDHVVMVGAFDCFELWSPDRLESAGGMDRGTLRQAAQYVGF